MELYKKIIQARKAKGITQEELATLSKINLRTIQRIESGESTPRPFTRKAIEDVLGIQPTVPKPTDTVHFLHLFCLSCFSYLVIPYVHFLIPNYLLKRRNEQNPEIRHFARQVIRMQIYWVIATLLVFLTVLLINFAIKYFFNTGHYISYLIPFFGMYLLNSILIGTKLYQSRAFAV